MIPITRKDDDPKNREKTTIDYSKTIPVTIKGSRHDQTQDKSKGDVMTIPKTVKESKVQPMVQPKDVLVQPNNHIHEKDEMKILASIDSKLGELLKRRSNCVKD